MAFNPAISNAISDNTKDEDNIIYNDMIDYTICRKRELCMDCIKKDMAGKSYDNNYRILCQEPNIFNRGQICEILITC